jgi:hypothetical protein
MIKRIALGTLGLFFIAAVGLELSAATAYANKVDCGKVMAEINAGKKGTEVAKDLSISPTSVYKCKKKAKAAAAKASPAASPAAAASPASH